MLFVVVHRCRGKTGFLSVVECLKLTETLSFFPLIGSLSCFDQKLKLVHFCHCGAQIGLVSKVQIFPTADAC